MCPLCVSAAKSIIGLVSGRPAEKETLGTATKPKRGRKKLLKTGASSPLLDSPHMVRQSERQCLWRAVWSVGTIVYSDVNIVRTPMHFRDVCTRMWRFHLNFCCFCSRCQEEQRRRRRAITWSSRDICGPRPAGSDIIIMRQHYSGLRRDPNHSGLWE